MKASPFDYYTNKELIQALIYSGVRYLIYSFQYLCLLYFFGFEASCLATFLGILIVYLLQTGIPLPPSTGLLARGNIALLIFGYLSGIEGTSMVILSATFSLWMLNVVLPSIVGALVVVRLGWNEKEEKKNEHQSSCSIFPHSLYNCIHWSN